jgi:hypothetical protein
MMAKTCGCGWIHTLPSLWQQNTEWKRHEIG